MTTTAPTFDSTSPDDPRFSIRIRNWDHFQYRAPGRPTKHDPQRLRWARLHTDMLLSQDWVCTDADTKVLMIALMMLALQYDNRIPNDHSYLAVMCRFYGGSGVPDIKRTTKAWTALYRAGNGGFFELTLLPKSGTDHEEMTKPSRAKPRRKATSKRFDDFWKVYPNRKDKKAARDRWERNDLDQHADAICAAVVIQTKQEAWTKEGGKYIPLPSTYLNKERWLDEATTPARNSGDLPTIPDERRW